MGDTLFNAKLKLQNDGFVSGPVTTEDNIEFLFRNTGSDLDLYFYIKKNINLKWQFSAGPNYEMPKDLIRQLGNLIDYHNTDPNNIELFADGLLHDFAPKDNSIKNVNFDFLLLPDLNLRVYYDKIVDNQGKEFWKFQGSTLLYY